jgi:hypothetical protein
MSSTLCMLNGQPVLRAAITIPRSRVWTAEIEAANILDTSGAATIVVNDITMKGTIIDGGPYATRGWYRVVGGAGGWRQRLKPKAYRSEAGVKLSMVANDAASEVGETLAAFTDSRIGPAFMRPAAFLGDRMSVEAARVLDLVAPENWYVEIDGSTHIGVRAATPFTNTYRLTDARPDLRRVEIAADSFVGLLPGAKLEGLEAATIRHELTDEGLRTHVFGTMGNTVVDRAWRGIARIVRALTMPFFYAGRFEYQVTGGSGGYLDVQPVNMSTGLPRLVNVPVRVGVMGARGTPTASSTVLVGFINADPSRPYIDSFMGETGNAPSVAQESDIFAAAIKLGDATARPLSHSLETGDSFSAISTALAAVSLAYAAINTYAIAIKLIADPTNAATPTLTAAMGVAETAMTTAEAAIATASSTLPTTIANGT